MSIHFLNQTEIEQLNLLPNDISQIDLTTYFKLSKEDVKLLTGLRGDHNRLGVALLVGCLRHLGFFPSELPNASSEVVAFVAKQLAVDPTLLERIYTRKRISRQLNKGEALHALRSQLLFGKHGEIEGLEDEPLDLQAACLNLVTNAIVIFNTVHMSKIVDDLKQEGHTIRDADLARVWPTRFGHINFLGKYHFKAENIRPGVTF
jgi:hypothetical protein